MKHLYAITIYSFNDSIQFEVNHTFDTWFILIFLNLTANKSAYSTDW